MDAEGGLLAALFAGLLGSAHCLAMCGGIAGWFGLNTAAKGATGRPLFSLAYNGGRLTGYVLLGALAGLLGAGSGALLGFQHWGAALRIAFGLVIILIGLQLAFGWSPLRGVEALGARGWRRLTPLASRLLPASSALHAAALGILWGWLPCGLVYSVLLAAAVSGGPAEGAQVMLAFGIGTLPSMLAATGGAARLSTLTRLSSARRAAGMLVVITGLWTLAMPVMHIMDPSAHDHVPAQTDGGSPGHH